MDSGLNSVAVNLPVAVGNYIAFTGPAGVAYAGDGTAGKNPYYYFNSNAIGAPYPVAPTGLDNSANQFQAGFDVSYGEFRGLKYQTIGQAAYNALGTYDPNTLYVITGALARDDDRPGIEELPAEELPPIGETLPELPEAEQ